MAEAQATQQPQSMSQDSTDEAPAIAPSRRKRLLLILAVVTILGLAAWLAWYLLVGSTRVTTDNAYVGADVAQVTPLVAGAVTSVRVADTQPVRRGDILMTIDSADARIALATAQASLAQARQRYDQTAANNTALGATVAARDADISQSRAKLDAAAANLDRARIDLQRRQKLAPTGAVSGEELTSARSAFADATAAYAQAAADVRRAASTRTSAQGELAANRALTDGTTARSNPEVAAAQARLDQVRLDMERTVIRAPIDGIVARRNVQVGQRVAAGTPAMTIVPVGKAYVDANFKESQLAKVRVGQRAELVSDFYGDDVVFHGRIAGFAGGTGAAFSVIPAQNATGNWIKVVQRLPLRITLDPRELAAHPLRVGLSMDVTVHLDR
ncbi:efflux RND transporter periplasmic adaptor subunit [Sphingomonas montana]|uniref:efflux RND transporter periplasmic adaptor subunit n=1 Tax=Sphingomonas montana TaxID=1843236 RepID=UPI00096D2D1C|nr:efflux RND transporter periplasmic adaptor subunit [Sphingomonas montana]